DRRVPKHQGLREVFADNRRLVDVVGVFTWRHHYCGCNKMADAAVNHALDTKTSGDGPPEQQHRTILQHLENDVNALVASRHTQISDLDHTTLG
ncbi:TPA: hypothetical protein N0F65_007919, partial [Lagenidium giganteum]